MSELQDRLARGTVAVGVELSHLQLEQLLELGRLLLDWNTRMNLTAIRELPGVVDRHLVDSLAVAPHLVPGSLVDVGTGAGFPGLPLALVRSDLAVTLLESIHKKTSFVRAAARALGLQVTVCTERLERWGPLAKPQQNAVSRATFAPTEWVRRGTPLLAPSGVLIAMTTPAEPNPETIPGFSFSSHDYRLPDDTLRVLWRFERGILGCFT